MPLPHLGSAPRALVAAATMLLAASAVALSAPAPAQAKASRSSTPGSLTGYAFDTCTAPSQAVMDAWREASPYSGIGIYIGGSQRQCDQPELTPDWVRTQVRNDWHLLPLYVGPQASCSGYADRMSSDLTTATQQGRDQAAAAVAAAQALGIGSRSTLYYDLEDYDIGPTDCRQAALSFLSGWTDGLHAAGYDSGVYSNIAAAITSLDYADRVAPGSYLMPDDIWFAWANGQVDTVTDDRVQSSRWDDHARVHQYELGVLQTYGGAPLIVDANWVDVGEGSVAPRQRQLCKGVDVDLRRYPTLSSGRRGPAVEALQCLLRQQRFLEGPITGRYDERTLTAVRKAKDKLDVRITLHTVGRVTGRTWTALLARGNSPLLKVGATGSSVFRLQRALTAGGVHTRVDGLYSKRTERAVKKYQRKHRLTTSGVVTKEVWDELVGR